MVNLLVATAGWLVKPTQARALKLAPPRSSSSNADANPGWLSRHSSLPSPGIEPPRTLRRSRSAGPDQAPLSKRHLYRGPGHNAPTLHLPLFTEAPKRHFSEG